MKAGLAVRLTVLAVLGWAAASACAASDRSDGGKTIIVTEQTEKSVKARVGKSVEIQLRAQPGTGFSWIPKSYVANLTPMEPTQGQAIPGGWQTQRFRFVAKRPGTYRLTFSYDRPWAGGTKGARTARFTIVVR